MVDDPAKRGWHGVVANLDALRRAIRRTTPRILAAVIAVGTPDLGTAQTMSVSQPVTVLRGQPAAPSNQSDQPAPTVETSYLYWYPYSYYYPDWWYAGYPWGWGWGAPWGWGWPVGGSVAFGGCFNCRFHSAFFHRRFFHPAFIHTGFVHPGFVHSGFVHTGFSGFGHPGFVHMGFHGGFGGGFHGGRR